MIKAREAKNNSILARNYDSDIWDKSWSGEWFICWLFQIIFLRFKYDIVSANFREV